MITSSYVSLCDEKTYKELDKNIQKYDKLCDAADKARDARAKEQVMRAKYLRGTKTFQEWLEVCKYTHEAEVKELNLKFRQEFEVEFDEPSNKRCCCQ